jgi:archaellum component FlaF (FlaF/FlaG flagellin family)
MRTFLVTLAALLVAFAALYVSGRHALERVERAQALACARSSDGADQSIADCYTSRGLAVPEDL